MIKFIKNKSEIKINHIEQDLICCKKFSNIILINCLIYIN